MFDHIAIVKCIELKNEQDRARWRHNEDEFYRDLGHSPFEALAAICRRMRRVVFSSTRDHDLCARDDGAALAISLDCGGLQTPFRNHAA